MNDENDNELNYRPVDDCRYTGGDIVEPEVWTKIQIPLSHLDAADRMLQRVGMKNNQSETSSFWVDEIRLIGASWKIYLPLAVSK